MPRRKFFGLDPPASGLGHSATTNGRRGERLTCDQGENSSPVTSQRCRGRPYRRHTSILSSANYTLNSTKPNSWRVGSMNDVALARGDDPPLRTSCSWSSAYAPPPREIAGRLHRVLRKPRTLPLHLKSLPSGDSRERF